MPKAENNTGEKAYAKLAAHFLKKPTVTQSDKFGKGLRFEAKVFSMMVKGELVLKLSEKDVEALIRSRKGKPFAHGKKVMKEWVVVPVDSAAAWPKLAQKAFDHAAT